MAGPRLGETGQIYVTVAAGRRYADFEDLQIEEARKELTDLLIDAKPVGTTGSGAERWRYQRQSEDIDVSAIVVREDRLAVVVAVNVRADHRKRGRRG